LEPLPPFLFAAKTQRERRLLARLRAEERIRRIGPRLYTSLPDADVGPAARKAWSTIASALFPGALVSHRTALEYIPSPEGAVFLTSTTNKKHRYPGLTIEFIRGPGPLEDDRPFVGLRASSLPRALLENFKRDARASILRALPIEEIERRLEQILQDGGEAELNAIRDRAREISVELGWRAEFDRLDGAIGALLGTRSADRVKSAAAKARAAGEPFDPSCLERLQLLVGELKARALRSRPEASASPAHFRNKAFFESYFSNYIEGTRFEIEEAEGIVFDKQIPAQRPADAHDVLGTFNVVSDADEMRRVPASPDELVELLKARHHTMLSRRPDALPGRFKERLNRAGDTVFVHPDYVVGTLKKGHELYAHVAPGLARAIFMMFLVSDVHPFLDGNGRVARIMMNAELVAERISTIIIPTVFREDHLLTLRALTRRGRAKPLVDALAKAAAFSHLDFSDYPRILADLQARNWFHEPDEARIITGDR
jgi:hypothetical protein